MMMVDGATVEQNTGWPSEYLWIVVAERRYFLGVRTAGMTRGQVRTMAREFLAKSGRAP